MSESKICDNECDIIITVLPFLIASNEFLICSVAIASKLAVGSSKKIIGGFLEIIWL